jgi:predicted PolB exonuclease-like 3'-5' exonuclease
MQKRGKNHLLYCLFENSRKTGIVTHCYSEIVAKVHAFPLALVVDPNQVKKARKGEFLMKNVFSSQKGGLNSLRTR